MQARVFCLIYTHHARGHAAPKGKCVYIRQSISACVTVKPVYYGHLGTNQRCPDYQGVLIFQVSLYDKAPFGTTAKCPDYAGVHIFKCPG